MDSLNNIKQSSISEVLKSEKVLTYKVMGKSMEPIIVPNRDLVTIRLKDINEVFQINDVVLYKSKGKLVLHRIVQEASDCNYVLLGDNCSQKEHGISSDDIIGKMVSFKHAGIHYDVNDSNYLKYVSVLRKNETKRMHRKLLYDIITQGLQFLPDNILFKVKGILKELIVYKISLDK